MSRRKLWIVVSIAAVVLAALVVTLVFVFAKPSATSEDYVRATTSAQEVSKQYNAFNEAGQALVNGTDTQTASQLKTQLSAAYENLMGAQKELADSPAVKQAEVESEFNAYNKKAVKFVTLAEQYNVSIPLYADMRETCSQIGKVTVSNLIQELQALSQSILDQSKESSLKRFDTQVAGCLDKAKVLQRSGDNSFAQLGGVFVTFLEDTRKGVETRFNDVDSVGASRAERNYIASTEAVNIQAAEALQSISKRQTADNEATDYAVEIETLIKTLQSNN